MAQSSMLDTVFDPRRNSLNALRLLLALSVILWHSVGITGGDISSQPVRQLVSRISVDSFFAISGFLIYSSWERNPRWIPYMRARALRIFPAYWVCIVITAAVIAPLALALQGSPLPQGYLAEATQYVVRNGALWVFQYDIAGTPSGTPIEGAWNGSIWTLAWEFLCYLGVLLLGLLGLFKRPLIVPVAFVITVLAVMVTSYGPVDNFFITTGARFGVMFVAGMMMFHYRRSIPVNGYLIVAALLIVLASSLLPDYRLVSALPVAYLMISAGALIRTRQLQLRNDLSYGTYIYAFPLQQLLAMAGGADLPLGVFMALSIILTLPMAAFSWFLVERPLLRFKSSRADLRQRGVQVGRA